jgi:hypothetical protein
MLQPIILQQLLQYSISILATMNILSRFKAFFRRVGSRKTTTRLSGKSKTDTNLSLAITLV